MITSVTSLPLTTTAVARGMTEKAGGFHQVVDKHIQEQAKKRKEAQDAAAGLVAHALILPMLKQVRRSVFNQDGPFSPGNAEKSFGPEFDMQMADRLARSPRMAATQALTDRILKRGHPQQVTKGLDING